MQAAEQGAGVTLADLLGAFSLATDLGLGQPMEHLLRAWRIAAALGEHLGLSEPDGRRRTVLRRDVWPGWAASPTPPRSPTWFGDDIAFRGRQLRRRLRRAAGARRSCSATSAPAGPPLRPAPASAPTWSLTGGKAVQRGLMSHCLTTSTHGRAVRARRGRVRPRCTSSSPAGTARGARRRRRRADRAVDAAVPPGRHRRGAPPTPRRRGRRRGRPGPRGKHFDPAVVDAFCARRRGRARWNRDAEHDWHERSSPPSPSAAAPAHRGPSSTPPSRRSPTSPTCAPRTAAGHSRAVAELAARAAAERGLPAADVDRRPPGRRCCTTSACTACPPPSSTSRGRSPPTEQERLRMHPYYTERVLARPPALARIGAIAVAHPRAAATAPATTAASAGDGDPATARLLAAACAFQAMTEPRAHRPALTAKQAAAALRGRRPRPGASTPKPSTPCSPPPASRPRQAPHRPGRPHPAGDRGPDPDRPGRARPARWRDGWPSRRRRPSTHIERIYAKTGATTRSTATLFALQHGLLGTLEPLDL